MLVADQLSKWWLLEVIEVPARAPISLTPFFNLVMVWNHGVSFGMMSHPETWMPRILIAVALMMVVALAVWLHRNGTTRMARYGIALVIGGALGNVIDRVRFGAVADFFDLHVMGYHWPAFNVADAAICCGVALLLFDGFRSPAKAVATRNAGLE